MAPEPYVTKTGMVVDPARLKRNGETLMFTPFRVEGTQPLTQALESGEVAEEADLLISVREGRALALLRSQMAYHHVAQGTVRGEPWLVFF
ncbi:MAG: hypothetical protein H6712_35390 [Myxococcales bacterium]|nr:hypothetical protein [Myxococcales bacterium]MCB9719181.1 hypothetical protein [Myxococcales bacterium]